MSVELNQFHGSVEFKTEEAWDGSTRDAIYLNSVPVWYDHNVYDAPEDCIWSRDIGDLALDFYNAGLEAGRKGA